MSGLYVYGIAGAGIAAPLGGGLAGEPLRWVAGGAVRAVAGELAEPPAPAPAALAAHDAAVRRLAAQVPALLPARFGQFLPDEHTLRHWLTAHARELTAALERVAGCVQMTLRVFAAAAATAAAPVEAEEIAAAAEAGPGTRYMERRRREVERLHSLPEIAALREALRPLLRDERIERAAGPGRLRGTAYDLIAGGEVAEYSRIVAATAPRLTGCRVTASGPWPPYAFAPRVPA